MRTLSLHAASAALSPSPGHSPGAGGGAAGFFGGAGRRRAGRAPTVGVSSSKTATAPVPSGSIENDVFRGCSTSPGASSGSSEKPSGAASEFVGP